MSVFNGMPVNFTISERAKSAIIRAREEYAQAVGEPPGVTSIGWGTYTPDSGTGRFDSVALGFYEASQTDEIRHGVERVAGLDILFFITAENYPRFAGKVLDHTPEQGLFLRSPMPGES